MVPVGSTLISSVASDFPVEKSLPVCEKRNYGKHVIGNRNDNKTQDDKFHCPKADLMKRCVA
jgi:hypothetical protein